MNLAEIVKMPEGFTPPDLSVEIKKVYDRKSGENSNGAWSFQSVGVAQDGVSAYLKLKNLPEFPKAREGQSVIIRANQSKQHGLTGIKMEYYNEKPQIVVTQSAKWEWANGDKAPSAAPESPQNALESIQAYTDHLLSCAALANQITTILGIQDEAAMQASFATICIDTKNRGILLPKDLPATPLSAEPEEPNSTDEPPPDWQDLEDAPF